MIVKTDVSKLVPKPNKLRQAIALNIRQRKALELALKTSEYIAAEVTPMANEAARQDHQEPSAA